MAQTLTFNGRRRVRKFFGKIPEVAEMPNLIEVQKSSYDLFLKSGDGPKAADGEGIQGVFQSVFPIKDFSGRAEIDFVKYELEEPKYDVEECQQRGDHLRRPLLVQPMARIRDHQARHIVCVLPNLVGNEVTETSLGSDRQNRHREFPLPKLLGIQHVLWK